MWSEDAQRDMEEEPGVREPEEGGSFDVAGRELRGGGAETGPEQNG